MSEDKCVQVLKTWKGYLNVWEREVKLREILLFEYSSPVANTIITFSGTGIYICTGFPYYLDKYIM
jgi:hypothetical protein